MVNQRKRKCKVMGQEEPGAFEEACEESPGTGEAEESAPFVEGPVDFHKCFCFYS